MLSKWDQTCYYLMKAHHRINQFLSLAYGSTVNRSGSIESYYTITGCSSCIREHKYLHVYFLKRMKDDGQEQLWRKPTRELVTYEPFYIRKAKPTENQCGQWDEHNFWFIHCKSGKKFTQFWCLLHHSI